MGNTLLPENGGENEEALQEQSEGGAKGFFGKMKATTIGKVGALLTAGAALVSSSGCNENEAQAESNDNRVVASASSNGAGSGVRVERSTGDASSGSTEKARKLTLAEKIEQIKRDNIKVVDGKRIWRNEWDLDEIVEHPNIDEDALVLFLYSQGHGSKIEETEEEYDKRKDFLKSLWPKAMPNQIEGQGHNFFKYYGTTEPQLVETENGILDDHHIYLGIGQSYTMNGHAPQAICVAQIAGTSKKLGDKESLSVQRKFVDDWLYKKLDNYERDSTQRILDKLAKND